MKIFRHFVKSMKMRLSQRVTNAGHWCNLIANRAERYVANRDVNFRHFLRSRKDQLTLNALQTLGTRPTRLQIGLNLCLINFASAHQVQGLILD